MKSILKKITITILSINSLCVYANAQNYDALPLRYFKENNTAKLYYSNASILVKKTTNRNEIIELAKKIISSDTPTLGTLITDKKSLSRASKIVKASSLKLDDVDNVYTTKIGNFHILIYNLPQSSKLKDGMNIFVFEKQNGNLLWNVSFNDPLLPLLATTDINNIKAVKSTSCSAKDAKIIDNLQSKDLPILMFKNGAFVSMDKIADVDDLPVSKFYHKAQDVFYSWNLDGYTQYLTKYSKEKFDSQFKDMSDDDRKKSLGEYFKWTKDYLKVLDAGEDNIIFFQRSKDGAKSYNDYAYIQSTSNSTWAITNFSANKSILDTFLTKYLISGEDYFKLISSKYLK